MRNAYSNNFHSLVLQSWIAKKSYLIREIIAGEREGKSSYFASYCAAGRTHNTNSNTLIFEAELDKLPDTQVWQPSNNLPCKAEYIFLLGGTYSAHTQPGWWLRSSKSSDRYTVPGMRCFWVKKYSWNVWFLPSRCQSHQILSTKPWCRKNSGADAESNEHIVPLITQWTRSWNSSRNAFSNLSKFDESELFMISNFTAIASGVRLPLQKIQHNQRL